MESPDDHILLQCRFARFTILEIFDSYFAEAWHCQYLITIAKINTSVTKLGLRDGRQLHHLQPSHCAVLSTYRTINIPFGL